ncbi:hypothetical protein A2773_06775 [Candidatus Gottesmanbacteria bacterium RIFCSPHIGHO2_01_FULL_39_10]|uniref:Antitoxin n=1 Tax=Candidatus Gottesmanbacteria bacterium RIFCSPHIGHO2_01_FULL_39_10 TaxID=1798375 RepID=A0A1F5ZPI4_9BACT|nr:MAG: hypothetical protein A2773_06775 [Candidatus Gottesmanbacteria bacterium RIFCSPHIGHO2_01_FULL_39_10]
MKQYNLDKEELQILNDIEAGKFKTVDNVKEEIEMVREAAKNSILKKKNINIRLTLKTLMKLKARAIEEGIPYQTLASSILHKYVNSK